jgi:hypothetical protein
LHRNPCSIIIIKLKSVLFCYANNFEVFIIFYNKCYLQIYSKIVNLYVWWCSGRSSLRACSMFIILAPSPYAYTGYTTDYSYYLRHINMFERASPVAPYRHGLLLQCQMPTLLKKIATWKLETTYYYYYSMCKKYSIR